MFILSEKYSRVFCSVMLSVICMFNICVLPSYASSDYEIVCDYTDSFVLTASNKSIFNKKNIAPGESWESNINIINNTSSDIVVSLTEITNNSDDDILLDAMCLELYDDNAVIYQGGYHITDSDAISVTVPSGDSKTVVAKVGLNAEADNRVQGKSLDTTWVFTGEVLDDTGTDDTQIQKRSRVRKKPKPTTQPEQSGIEEKSYSYNISCVNPNGNIISTVTRTINRKGIVLVKAPEIEGYETYMKWKLMILGAEEKNISFKYHKINSDNMDETLYTAYMNGYADDEFRPYEKMTRAEVSAVFARLIAEQKDEAITGISTFYDVSAEAWYYKYVGYLEQYNIVSGYEDGGFRPDEQITRAEFVTMCIRLYTMFNSISMYDESIFIDIPDDYWAKDYISTATIMGWINGYEDESFRPTECVSRAEVAAILNRLTNRNPVKDYIDSRMDSFVKFTDISEDEWFFYDVVIATNTFII